jgi:uncharacterized protein
VVSSPITFDDLKSIAIGAGILGTGGSTHPYLELLNAEKLYRAGRSVELIDPSELADDDLVAEISKIGAPLPSIERIADPALFAKPVRMIEDHVGCRFKAIMPGEIGTVNGVIPIMVAAELGLPLVDADPIGRAFPGVHMSSFAIAGLPYFPFAVADIRENEVIITRSVDGGWTERIARRVSIEMGTIAATCRPPRTGRQIRDHAILGSITRAIRLGLAVRNARSQGRQAVDVILEKERGLVLFKGKVVDAMRRTTEGFLRGHCDIAGLDEFDGCSFTAEFRNEFTVARRDGSVCATTPDLICVLDAISGQAIGTEHLRYGQRVFVLGMPAAPIFLSPAGLGIVGPRALGYDLDYVPLFTGAQP